MKGNNHQGNGHWFRRRIIEMGFVKGKSPVERSFERPIKYKIMGYKYHFMSCMIEVVSEKTTMCVSLYGKHISGPMEDIPVSEAKLKENSKWKSVSLINMALVEWPELWKDIAFQCHFRLTRT